MKRLFNRIFRKKDQPKKFEFYMHEIVCSGNYYRYIVEAPNRDEAMKKLVDYFFGSGTKTGIETESGIVHRPQHDSFVHHGMPYWFAERISGSGSKPEEAQANQKKLEDYCKCNNIPYNRS